MVDAAASALLDAAVHLDAVHSDEPTAREHAVASGDGSTSEHAPRMVGGDYAFAVRAECAAVANDLA